MAVTVEMHHAGERGVAAAEKATADVRAAGRRRDPKSHQASMCGVAVCRRLRRLHESCKRHPPGHTTGPISPRPSTRVPPAESARVSRLPFAPSSTAPAPACPMYSRADERHLELPLESAITSVRRPPSQAAFQFAERQGPDSPPKARY